MPRLTDPALVTFRSAMYLRIGLVTATAALLPAVRQDPLSVRLLALVGAASWLAGRLAPETLPIVAARPVLLCLDALAGFGVMMRIGPTGLFFPATMVTSALAGVLYAWPGLLAVCALQVVLCQVTAHAQGLVDLRTVVELPMAYPLAGLAGIGLHRFFDRYAAAEQAYAAAEERARLAREMHDSLVKTLHGIGLSVEALPILMARSPARAEREAAAIGGAIRVALGEARELVDGLRDGRALLPLPDAVRRAAPHAEVTVTGHPDPPPPVRYELLAVLREALANAARHAASATVAVVLTETSLTVRDDGPGFDCPPDWPVAFTDAGHYGLLGMAERAGRAGCELTVVSAPGAGTSVTLAFPEVWP